MTKTIAKKDLYRELKIVSDDVVKNGTVYTVFQHSKPAFYIVPVEVYEGKKKFKREDMTKFIFHSKNLKEKNLATNYKQYLY